GTRLHADGRVLPGEHLPGLPHQRLPDVQAGEAQLRRGCGDAEALSRVTHDRVVSRYAPLVTSAPRCDVSLAAPRPGLWSADATGVDQVASRGAAEETLHRGAVQRGSRAVSRYSERSEGVTRDV